MLEFLSISWNFTISISYIDADTYIQASFDIDNFIVAVASSVRDNGNPLVLKHVQVGGQQTCISIKIQKLLHKKCKLPRKL